MWTASSWRTFLHGCGRLILGPSFPRLVFQASLLRPGRHVDAGGADEHHAGTETNPSDQSAGHRHSRGGTQIVVGRGGGARQPVCRRTAPARHCQGRQGRGPDVELRPLFGTLSCGRLDRCGDRSSQRPLERRREPRRLAGLRRPSARCRRHVPRRRQGARDHYSGAISRLCRRRRASGECRCV
jgi:hypothetical protein